MKKLIMAAVIAMSASTANAAETYCDIMYDLAELVMSVRQDGLTMKQTKKIIKEAYANDDNLEKTAITLTNWAYETPKFQSKQLKKNAVNSFAEKAYYSCEKVYK